MLHPAFEAILRAGRDEFNARFADARRTYPRLNPDEFKQLLAGPVEALVAAVATIDVARATDAARHAYGVALELLGQDLLGPRARHAAQPLGWEELLPALAPWVARDPARVLAAVANALHNLGAQSGARAEEWIGLMQDYARSAPTPTQTDVSQLMKFGQVAAWRCGMAQYREGALAMLSVVEQASPPAARLTPANMSTEACVARLHSDPWWNPALASGAPALEIVARIGGFTGFGGPFAQPPLAVAVDGQLVAVCGTSAWLITADAFGATLTRMGTAPNASPTTNGVSKEGLVHWRGFQKVFSQLASCTSAAANVHTMAVTTSLSHHVYLLAQRSQP